MKIKIFIAAIVAVMLLPAFCAAGDVIVICNPSVQISTLSKKDVKYIFLGRKTTWNDHSKIIFATQEGTTAQKDFIEEYLRKNPMQFTDYWRKQVFTGRGSYPKSFKSDQEMIKFIIETKGAIGYVSSSANVDNVKTINIK